MINKFTDLEIWQLAKDIVIKTYRLLNTFPIEEKYGVVAQCKDSVVSIPSNIAEAFGRYYFKDRIKFLYNSRGSLEETKSHLLLSDSLGFITKENIVLYHEILQDIEKLGVKLNNYIIGISNRIPNNK